VNIFWQSLLGLAAMIWLSVPLQAVAAEFGFSGMHVQGMKPAIATALQLKSADGVLVRDVALGGPADKAGVMRGDLIIRFNGVKIDTFKRLVGVVTKTRPEQLVTIKVMHSGGNKALKLKLGRKPPAWKIAKGSVISFTEIGITLAAITQKIRKRFAIRWGSIGVLVTLIDVDFINRMQLQRGDIIVQINQKPVWLPRQVRDAYEDAKKAGRKQLLMLVERVSGYEFMMLPVK
jgi:serine protease Do